MRHHRTLRPTAVAVSPAMSHTTAAVVGALTSALFASILIALVAG